DVRQPGARDAQGGNSFAVLADGKRFVIGGVDGTVLLGETATGEALNDPPGHRGYLSAVTLTEEGRTAVTFGGDGTLRRWDLSSGKEVGRTPLDGVGMFRGLAFAPDRKTALGLRRVDDGWAAELYDATTGKRTARLSLDGNKVKAPGGAFGWRALAWLPDGSVVVSEGACAVRVGADGRELQRYAADGGREVRAVAASPDGN